MPHEALEEIRRVVPSPLEHERRQEGDEREPPVVAMAPGPELMAIRGECVGHVEEVRGP